MRNELRQYWLRPGVVALVVIGIDQVTKLLIWQRLGPTPGTSMPVLGDWLRLTFVQNTGIAFGMFQGIPHFFTLTSIAISIGAMYYYRYQLPGRHPIVQVLLGMIVGGAIGNIIDRVRLGFVIDFVHVTWFPGIFNVADSNITVGVLALAVYLMLVGEERHDTTRLDDTRSRDLPLDDATGPHT